MQERERVKVREKECNVRKNRKDKYLFMKQK